MKNNYIFNNEWIAGFTQTDGSFVISFEKKEKGIPIRPTPVFNLSQSIKEWDMFCALQNYLKVGKIYKNREDVVFVVKSLEELITVILPIFDNVSLRGGKLLSYLIFREVVLLMKDKKHWKLEGILQILELSYFMNKDTTLRSEKSKELILNRLKMWNGSIPEFERLKPPLISLPGPLTKEFVRGQVDGDGSFNIAFRSNIRRIGLHFTVVHEISSINVLYELMSFFKCGSVYNLPSAAGRYQVQNLDDLLYKVIPVFKTIKFNTQKQKQFDIFVEICHIIKDRGYKNDEDLKEIVELGWYMNDSNTRKLSKEDYLSRFLCK